MPSENPTPPATLPKPPRSRHAPRLAEFPELIFAELPSLTAMRGRWASAFRDAIGPAFDGRITFEIGCNDAVFLADVAARHPTTAFVGLDWKVKAIVDAADRVIAAKLKNVLLIRGRAQELNTTFATGELNEIWLFHPDPCDRDVERPNRLMSPAFLRAVHDLLPPGGRLCLKTDHAEYATSTAASFEADPDLNARFATPVRSSDFWNDASAQQLTAGRAFAGAMTTFERKFRAKRVPIHYIEFQKR